MNKLSIEKKYWLIFSIALAIMLLLRLISFLVMERLLFKLDMNEMLPEGYVTSISNYSGFIAAQVKWMCYLCMGFWALFWIDNKLSTLAYIIGIILFWGIQYLVMYLCINLGPSYVSTSTAARNVYYDSFLNEWPKIILLGSVLYRWYRKKA